MKESLIEQVHARQIYDSRANPTIEVEVTLAGGAIGRGIVPSGASTGLFEALELRDGDSHFSGKGVSRAISFVNSVLGPAIVGLDARDQRKIDRTLVELDGTPNKKKYGANAILGCSLSSCYAAAAYEREPLYRYLGGAMANTIPVPMVQIIGGGAHAANAIDLQDFLVIPLSASSFADAFAMVAETYMAAKKLFSEMGRPVSIADEGGFWPTGFKTNEEGIALLTESIRRAGYQPGIDLGIALDIASSEFYDKERKEYDLKLENKRYTSEEFVDLLCNWVDRYPIISIEDGTSELDWEGGCLLTKKLGGRIQLIGDDLFTTNIQRIEKGVALGCCNAVLIKMNQIGTITETIDAITYTQQHGFLPVISARSGETEDATIAHLAIACGAGQLKVGSAARGERTAKWNEVIRIEEALGTRAVYPSKHIFEGIAAMNSTKWERTN
jgi:enolase